MLPNKKRSRFEDDSTLLFISTSGGILPTRFESFEILIKACCPFPGTLLDFRFIHDPEGIARPYALAKIAGGQRGNVSLKRLLLLNGKRLSRLEQEKKEKDGEFKVDEKNDSKSVINEEVSSMDLTLRVTVEPEDLLRIEAATKLRKGEDETTHPMSLQEDIDESSKNVEKLIEMELAEIRKCILKSTSSTDLYAIGMEKHSSSSNSSSSSSTNSAAVEIFPIYISPSIPEGPSRDFLLRFKQQQQHKAREREHQRKLQFETDVRRIVEGGRRFLENELAASMKRKQQEQSTSASINLSHPPNLTSNVLLPSSSSSSLLSLSHPSSLLPPLESKMDLFSCTLPNSLFECDTLEKLALPLLLLELKTSLGVGEEEELSVAKQILADIKQSRSATTILTDLTELLDEKEAKKIVYRLLEVLLRDEKGLPTVI